ncbi:MAG: hypothetical protein HOO96_30260 [Polyangiaceae bacterium]|nr:hypothetical protein [Polyangiaceae bacterium]
MTRPLFVPFLVALAVAACTDDPSPAAPDAGSPDAASLEASPPSTADAGDAGTRTIASGIYVTTKVGNLTLPLDASDGSLAKIVGRPYVRGISLQFDWADLEPTQGAYVDIVVQAVAAVRKLAAAAGKALTVKVHLRNGLPPAWIVPDGAAGDSGTEPFVFTTPLGFRALGQVSGKNGRKVDVTFIPTEPAYFARAEANIAEFGRQLEVADPNVDLVQIVQVAGPSSESGGTMRLTPRDKFPRNGAVDGWGFGWTFPKHIEAWRAMGPFMAKLPAYQKRQWTFDLTHQQPKDETSFGLTTADQMAVTEALVSAHPRGKAGIRLMNEGASAETNTPGYSLDGGAPTSCSWSVDNFDNPTTLPETTIAAWPGHEWQIQVAADASYNFPRFELARVTLFGDPRTTTPTSLQHTTFVEIHDTQALDDENPLLDGTSGKAWYGCFDAMLRKYAGESATLSDADRSFWTAMPSLSTFGCQAYPPPPPATTCAP